MVDPRNSVTFLMGCGKMWNRRMRMGMVLQGLRQAQYHALLRRRTTLGLSVARADGHGSPSPPGASKLAPLLNARPFILLFKGCW